MEFELQDDADNEFLEGLEDPNNQFAKSDSVIFLIDSQAFNFQHETVGLTNLQIVSNSYNGFLRDKLLMGNSDRNALIFYNCVTLSGANSQ